MASRHSLSAIDWIQAAFRALTAGGPQAIKVEAIARSLHVSKGSFYWHFQDVVALKKTMLQHWQEVAVEGIMVAVEARSDEPRVQIRALVEIAASDLSQPYGGALVEAAIRDWARYDEEVAEALKRADGQRLAFLRRLFRQLGAPKTLATLHANTLYGALIGLEQLSWKMRVDRKRGLSCLLELMLNSTTRPR